MTLSAGVSINEDGGDGLPDAILHMQSGQQIELVPPSTAVPADAFLHQLDLFFGQAVQVVGYAALYTAMYQTLIIGILLSHARLKS